MAETSMIDMSFTPAYRHKDGIHFNYDLSGWFMTAKPKRNVYEESLAYINWPVPVTVVMVINNPRGLDERLFTSLVKRNDLVGLILYEKDSEFKKIYNKDKIYLFHDHKRKKHSFGYITSTTATGTMLGYNIKYEERGKTLYKIHEHEDRNLHPLIRFAEDVSILGEIKGYYSGPCLL